MRKCLYILVALMLTGCSFGTTKTVVHWWNGKEITVVSKNDALVQVEKDGQKITVDNRGKRSFWEDFLMIWAAGGTKGVKADD